MPSKRQKLNIDLVHPLYLDVPMTTSFLAALEDGVAYGADVTRKGDRQRSAGAETEGKIGVPSLSVLSSMLNIDMRGNVKGSYASGDSEEVKLARKHTEASLFIKLRSTLYDRNLIITLDDEEELGQIRHGALVEVTGQVFRSPLIEVLEFVSQYTGMVEVNLEGKSSHRQVKGPKNQQSQQIQSAQQLLQAQQSQQGLALLKRLKEDLSKSKTIDAVMWPMNMEDLSVVIALSSQFLEEDVFDNLLSGNFTVLGKVTRILEPDEEISLYQRTIFNYLDAHTFEAALSDLRQNPLMQFPATSSFVKYPAIQLLPMAIFI